jgi:tRNA(Ile)-lysidine synthase
MKLLGQAKWGQRGWTLTADLLVTVVEQMQRQHLLFPEHKPHSEGKGHIVVVAVSGGADSVALLHLLHHLAPAWGLTLHVAHLDHALRADAAADADFVAELAAAYGLPFHHQRLQAGALAAAGGSLEAAARAARYAFLARVAVAVTRAGQPPTVALAHHADDQAETVLHHLVRGSGLDGLAGMRPVTGYMVDELDPFWDEKQPSSAETAEPVSVRLVRPLLTAPRTLIRQYLQAHQLTWREDDTNTDQRLTRNYLRHTVLPALAQVNPHVVTALGRTATLLAEERARLAAYDRALLISLLWPSGATIDGPRQTEIVLDLARLRALARPTQRALLRLALQHIAATPPELTFAHLDRLYEDLAQAASGGPHPILGDLAWSVAGATADHPALLSLHWTGETPFSAARPLLPAGVTIPLSADHGPVVLGNGWQATVTCGDRTALPADWRSPGARWRAFFDGDCIQRAILTTPTPGQRFAPLGLGGHHKLIGDLFTDQKIPVAQRAQWPILIDESTGIVHWICGVRPGHDARITSTTTNVLCVTLEPLAEDTAGLTVRPLPDCPTG